ncbi:MAG: V4R domain-containing protein [Candidatus Methanosuratincola verstraetei]|jgi:predicted hydrocarbon binding protein
MSYEFDLSRMLVLPGRKLVGLRFIIKADPEALAAVTKTAAKHRALPLYFASSPSAITDSYPVISFLDVTECDVPIDEFVKDLESTGMVHHAKVIDPVADGLIIDNLSFPLTAGGDRAIILRAAGYRGLIRGIKEQFGSGGEAFLYYEGLEAGRGFGRLHRSAAEAVGLKDPLEIYRRVSTAAFQWAGFGRIEVIHLGDSGGKIAVHDSFECEVAKVTGKPYGALVRGMIAGIFAEVFGKPFQVEETECIAKGDKRCVFEIREKRA